jgi:hypothetical protein
MGGNKEWGHRGTPKSRQCYKEKIPIKSNAWLCNNNNYNEAIANRWDCD